MQPSLNLSPYRSAHAARRFQRDCSFIVAGAQRHVPKDRDWLRVRMSDFAGRLVTQVVRTMVEGKAIEIMIHTSRQLYPRSIKVVKSFLIQKYIRLYNTYSGWVRALGCNDINVRMISASMRDEIARSKLLQRRTCMTFIASTICTSQTQSIQLHPTVQAPSPGIMRQSSCGMNVILANTKLFSLCSRMYSNQYRQQKQN